MHVEGRERVVAMRGDDVLACHRVVHLRAARGDRRPARSRNRQISGRMNPGNVLTRGSSLRMLAGGARCATTARSTAAATACQFDCRARTPPDVGESPVITQRQQLPLRGLPARAGGFAQPLERTLPVAGAQSRRARAAPAARAAPRRRPCADDRRGSAGLRRAAAARDRRSAAAGRAPRALEVTGTRATRQLVDRLVVTGRPRRVARRVRWDEAPSLRHRCPRSFAAAPQRPVQRQRREQQQRGAGVVRGRERRAETRAAP